jgi:hypothetical protein
MSKFYISNIRDNESNNTYYFITFKDEDNEEIDIVDDIADEIGIPVEACLDIYEMNGAVKNDGITDYKDLFLNSFQAQNALQEILEFAIEFNEDNCCDCEDYSDITPVFPNDFENDGKKVSDKEINEMIQECIIKLEDNIMTDVMEISQENTIIIVHRNRICDDPNCEGFNEYFYTITVCKNVYEYCGCPDCMNDSARD